MAKPSPSFSSVMVQVVSMLSAFSPCFCSSAESAIEKQPACAAASSSSGLVPVPCSKRSLNEYGVFERTPLAEEIVPAPDLRSPRHCAFALRSIQCSFWMCLELRCAQPEDRSQEKSPPALGETHNRGNHAARILRFTAVREKMRALAPGAQSTIEDALRTDSRPLYLRAIGMRQIQPVFPRGGVLFK